LKKNNKMELKLKKHILNSQSFRYEINGVLKKFVVRTITQKDLQQLDDAGCDFVVGDNKKIKVKKSKSNETKTDDSAND